MAVPFLEEDEQEQPPQHPQGLQHLHPVAAEDDEPVLTVDVTSVSSASDDDHNDVN